MSITEPLTPRSRPRLAAPRALVGVDVLLHWDGDDPERLAERLEEVCSEGLHLATIVNDGREVWPRGGAGAPAGEWWWCRFTDILRRRPIRPVEVLALRLRMKEARIEVARVEPLVAEGGAPQRLRRPAR